MNEETCYMCEAPSTSREHVPPLCIFPESKDLESGEDLRKDLITVPSCDIHNSKKSKDDELMLFVLTLNIANNILAKRQGFTKILRAVLRNPNLPNHFFSKNSTVMAVEFEGDAISASLAKIDYQRFLRASTHMAQGLYFHHYGRKFEGKCSIFADFMLQYETKGAVKSNYNQHTVAQIVKPHFDQERRYGSNPTVFTYSVLPPDNSGIIGARMQFFEASNIYVAYIPHDILRPGLYKCKNDL
ncbi:MAG: hypothetical protein ABSC54_04255 [Smithellaceae bacterium]|jgi:hypothetical protein